jgi:hypothetical protein
MVGPAAGATLKIDMLPVLLAAGLPDLDRLRELLKRIQEILAMGGVALALAASLIFLLAWVLSHVRRPSVAGKSHPVLSSGALLLSWVPVGLTAVAALGALVPALAPFVLKSFALAVVAAGFTWCIAVAAVVAGGTRQNLGRARRALLLAGTPWYCLAVYLSTFL